MPKTKPTRPKLPSNDLILAAIERAACHRYNADRPAESLSSIKQHLELPHNGWTTLQLRPKLEELQAAGLIEKSRRHSVDMWALTTKGRRRLGTVRRKLSLPESPQHRRWREAHAAASQRIAGFQNDLHAILNETIDLLGADPEPNSAAWFELSDRLHDACSRLASATYCLHEWQEPEDSAPDTDDAPYGQSGRRSWWAWSHD